MTKKNQTFIKKALKVHTDYSQENYALVEYTGSRVKVKIICPHCGRIYKQTPTHHLRGRGCKNCGWARTSDLLRKDTATFVRDALSHHADYTAENYKLVEYVNASTKVKIICPYCGEVYKQKPNQHLKGSACPRRCNMKPRSDYVSQFSKGHLLVREALEVLGFVNGETFFEEQEFEGCFYRRPLSFDFYVPNHRCLIEYQGKQHYKFVPFLHKTLRRMGDSRTRDGIKEQWAKDNGYLLLRIPYTVDRLDLVVKGLTMRLGL